MKKLWSAMLLLMFVATTPAMALTQLPTDPNVRVGVLPNGLTYYIRHNELPKGRADFHIAQAVGAILEQDNQNGLAHFLEHMAFNGTKHFPNKDLINYFELNGVNFGGNINAYTSLDETVYRLSDVPTIREGLIDSAILVMHDWSNQITLAGDEIDDERGVIREEWRTRADANRRLWTESNKLKYPNSQYAKRDIIGDTAVINNFTYKELRSYYNKWYGPDLQAIIIVGDIDVDNIEEKLKQIFSDVPERSNRGERPIYSVDNNKEPIVSIVLDKEAQQTRIEIEFKHKTPSAEEKLSVEGYAQYLANNLISTMLGYRFDEITSKPEASFVGAYGGYDNLFKDIDIFHFIAIPKEGQESQAYTDLLTEMERMHRYGFTEAELTRAKAEILTDYEKMYNERNKVNNITYAQEYIRNFLDNQPIPGAEIEFEIVKALLPQLSKEMINELAKSQITDENMIISFTGPKKSTVVIPNKEVALKEWEKVKLAEIAAPVEEVLNLTLVKKAPKSGKIKKVITNKALGTTEWILSNGVKVVIKPTTFKEDEILMSSFSNGGLAYVKNINDLPSALLAADIVESNGLGELSYIDLQKVLTGKRVSVSPFISQYSEGMNGQSTVKDFETMLQLIYLTQTAPRKDETAYAALMSNIMSALANRASNPKQAFSDSISATISSHNPRNVLFNLETVKQVNEDIALRIYKERFANPADFTFFFTGNIDPNNKDTQKLVATWLGGMKGKKNLESMKDDGIKMPNGHVINKFSREMQINTASNRIVYHANMPYNLNNILAMRAIGDILGIRYLESVREKEGGSYGVSTYGYVDNVPTENAVLLMQYDTDPDKQNRILEIIHNEISELIAKGPRPDDLKKVKESMLKDLDENMELNRYWQNVILKNFYIKNIDYVTYYRNTVQNITPEMIVETLKNLYNQKNVSEIIMVPAK